MSDIRRYIPDSTPIYLSGESSPEPTTCVVLGRDHERIVAELRAELKIQDEANEILARQNAELRAEVEAAHEALGNKAKEWAHSFETIAELRADVERLKQVRKRQTTMLINAINLRDDTIAKQRRVIEKIKTITEKMDCTCGERYSESSYRGDILEIIQRGEA